MLRVAANKLVSIMFVTKLNHELFIDGKQARLKGFKISTENGVIGPLLHADLEPMQHENGLGWILTELKANKTSAKQMSLAQVTTMDRHILMVKG